MPMPSKAMMANEKTTETGYIIKSACQRVTFKKDPFPV
jgi:hypothetical protein